MKTLNLCTTTAPLCCIPALYFHLSATLQTMSIIVVKLQDNRAVFRIFIALLRLAFDSLVQGPPANRAIWQRHFSIFNVSREGE